MQSSMGQRAVELRDPEEDAADPGGFVPGVAVPRIESIVFPVGSLPRLVELVSIAGSPLVVQADMAWAVLHLAATIEVRPTDSERSFGIQMTYCYSDMQWYFG